MPKEDLTWKSKAECKGRPELTSLYFYEHQNERLDACLVRESVAKAFCEICEIRQRCLDYANENPNNTEGGIWGGLNDSERKEYRRNQSNIDKTITTVDVQNT